MQVKVLTCLVTITWANVSEARIIKCVVNETHFLVIPMEDYPVPQAEGRQEMTLNAPNGWFAEVMGAEHDLVCRQVIDLDKFDDLPWTDFAPDGESEGDDATLRAD